MADKYHSEINKVTLQEFIYRLVSGNLTTDGIQWSSEVPTVDADTDYTILELTLDNDQIGDL